MAAAGNVTHFLDADIALDNARKRVKAHLASPDAEMLGEMYRREMEIPINAVRYGMNRGEIDFDTGLDLIESLDLSAAIKTFEDNNL